MAKAQQSFGGDWTAAKLERVRKYLSAYTTILKNFSFTYSYIDAFAGTGYINQKDASNDDFFPEFQDEQSTAFLKGSAQLALEVDPPFQYFVFVEKDPGRLGELETLKKAYPDKASQIHIKNEDANDYLQDICAKNIWDKHRAVLFLDPYGMQVKWKTIEAIARTNAIDMWLLFPLGVAVNRLLRRDAQIPATLKARLDETFGEPGWYEEIYRTRSQPTLFGDDDETEKVAGFDKIAAYFIRRLEGVFEGVAKNPLFLRNSMNNPLYLLCFAAGNKKGAPTAIKIAQHLLKE